jgi:AcrR family transcriptional regulator
MSNVAVKKKRAYQSPVRQRQADETRQRIASAARRLLEEKGYAGMTMEAVAKEAGVALPTVYAAFGSKSRILTEILDEARFGDSYLEAVREALATTDPCEKLKYAARIARRIYESEGSVLDLLRGAGVVVPELARLERERECDRYEAQAKLVDYLAHSKRLRADLNRKRAQDILWMLTSRDVYRMLTSEKGWSPEEFEIWLKRTLVETLASGAKSAKKE